MSEHKLLHLLKKKRGFFEAILDLTENETEVPLREWISILEQKKILLACIEEVDAELQHFQESFHMLSQDLHEEIEEMKMVIQRILRLDTLNQEKRKRELKYHREFS